MTKNIQLINMPHALPNITVMFISKGLDISNEQVAIIIDDMIYRVSVAYQTQKTITEHVEDVASTASFSDLIVICSEQELDDLLNYIRNTLLELFNMNTDIQFESTDTVDRVVGNRVVLRRKQQ